MKIGRNAGGRRQAEPALSEKSAAVGRRARRADQHDLAVGVGLGVRSGAQAAEVASFADVVIVGSAFVSRVPDGLTSVAELATELAEGVRARPAPVA